MQPLLSLLLLAVAIIPLCASKRTYCIFPDCANRGNHGMQGCISNNSSCLTLSELISSTNGTLPSNATLVFLPGEHHLFEGALSALDLDDLTLTGYGQGPPGATIVCNNSSLVFVNMSHLKVASLRFVSCSIQLYAVSVIFNETSFENGCANRGGALAAYNESMVSFFGHNTFTGNTAKFAGGAVYGEESTLSFSGATTFEDNLSGKSGGGGIFLVRSNASFTGYTNFTGNGATDRKLHCNTSYSADLGAQAHIPEVHGGGAMAILDSNVIIEGQVSYINNSLIFPNTTFWRFGGGAVHLTRSNVSFVGKVEFRDNRADGNMKGGGLYTHLSVVNFTGNTTFINNTAYRGNGIYVLHSSVRIAGSSLLTSAHRTGRGGAVYVHSNSSLTVEGESLFEGNSAEHAGGVYVWRYNNISFDGHTRFVRNSADRGGAMRVSKYDAIAFRGVAMFEYNHADYKGGALDLDKHITLDVHGNSTFAHNTAGRGGAIVTLDQNTISFEGNHSFLHNSADLGGAINSKVGSTYAFSGNYQFTSNSARIGAGMYVTLEGRVFMNGSVNFSGNCASHFGGGMAVRDSEVELRGQTLFTDNTAKHGGGVFTEHGELIFHGLGIFSRNSDTDGSGFGGAIHASSSSVEFEGNWNILKNTAGYGAGMALTGIEDRLLYCHPNTTLSFQDNEANFQGGAIFVEQNPFTYCEFDDQVQSSEPCIMQHQERYCQPEFHVAASEFPAIHLNFSNNTAGEVGDTLYGGSLESCYYCVTRDNYITGLEALLSLTNISNDSVPSLGLSSDPYIVYACEDSERNGTRNVLSMEVYPMQTIFVSVVAVGQMNAASPAVIRAITSDGITLDDSQVLQSVAKDCTELQYALSPADMGRTSKGSLSLYAAEPCSTSGFPLVIDINFLPCPSGFSLIAGECQCDSRLEEFEIECDIQNQTFLHRGGFWIGLIEEANNSKLILHPHCPFDYCMEDEVRFMLNDSDQQCASGRSGTLCGSCQPGLSLVLGSSHCSSCSNVYLFLLIPFILAGITLVALLFYLQLTVSTGTISGLVFYANILAVNKRNFFPAGETNILTVFIAWLNLDLGIETCFIDGLDEYARTWLQFLFPVYIWLLVALVTWLARVSMTVSKVIGKTNPVSVLATLFLLSYTKLLRTSIAAVSCTLLDYPGDKSKAVWLYDGNVGYLDVDDGKHIPLFLFSALALVVLFLPYSLLLFFGQWINRCTLNWISPKYRLRLKTFLDAHHAPYKDNQCYWIGLLLLLRFMILLISAVIDMNNPQDPRTNLVVILVIVSALQLWAWPICRGVYKKWYLDILEASFIFNLVVLIGGTYQISLSGGDQAALVYSSVSVAFVTFVGIVVHSIGQQKEVAKQWRSWRSAMSRFRAAKRVEDKDNAVCTTQEVRLSIDKSTRPSLTIVNVGNNEETMHGINLETSVELREPVLDLI